MQAVTLWLILLTLTGCATLSREECLRGDWYNIGAKDGSLGNPDGRMREHQEACAEYSVAVDSKAYLAGREQGLKEYCRLENAFSTGLEGHEYQYVCPPAIDALFHRYNAAAVAVFKDESEMERIQGLISSKEEKLFDSKLSDADRKHIRNEIQNLDQDRFRLRERYDDHRNTLEEYRREARRTP